LSNKKSKQNKEIINKPTQSVAKAVIQLNQESNSEQQYCLDDGWILLLFVKKA